MKRLRIFKYRDSVEFNLAFIIASDERNALKILSSHTALRCTMMDCRPLEDFPQAQKHYEFHGECVWSSNILPF